MQEVVLSLLVLLAGLPALDANDPEDKNSPFYYDWYRLRVGGLICAGILCAVGIIVLMITAQGMGRLSSHQALLTTAEDGPAEEHRAPLSPGPGFGGGLNSKMTSHPLLALPCLGLILTLSW
ncbi:FXYD domain-containing ion transport regulator 3 isoform X1 [Microtus ochrogaster]|uniref:FXYD domain-containing ion transport regulator n=1 Tax=Microtus ochrogaster TaxID=79684 RepID=A0ABM1UJE1_MICOH|nr:FXYD domain-containing ion transport regulator 3 isoform X1 [Microtus ochrogaster]